MTLPDFEISQADFKVPDHTASVSPAERVKERFSRQGAKPKTATPKRPRAAEPPSYEGEFTQTIADLYRGAAAVLFPLDPKCASVILDVVSDKDSKDYGKDRAQLCAEALDKAAIKSPGLRRFLRMVTTGGVWGAVIATHMPILMAIAMHHTPIMNKLSEFQSASFARMMSESDE